jgi:NTP pyrophosphatase (non-canonical NTP hydrolase)
MQTSLTFQRLRYANAERCEDVYHPLDAWSPTDWACALAGEVGEACNLVKKLRRLSAAPDDLFWETSAGSALQRKLADELADVVVYADLLATRLRINLETAVIDKFNRTSDEVGSGVKL